MTIKAPVPQEKKVICRKFNKCNHKCMHKELHTYYPMACNPKMPCDTTGETFSECVTIDKLSEKQQLILGLEQL